MHRSAPPLPPDTPTSFRATVHGTVFCDRAKCLDRIHVGDELVLIPGPPVDDPPGIWVHLRGGDLVGHLPPEIELWLAPWMQRGGSARATVEKLDHEDVPSWRRLVIQVDLKT
jgi:hypothetical protein